MHILAARRPNLRHLHPCVLRESRGHDFVGVFDVAVRRNRHRLRHPEHIIRLRDDPSWRPTARWRRVLGVSLGRAHIGPRDKRCNLLRRQRRIIGKMSAARIGEPRRHDPPRHFRFDLARISSRFVVIHQRHGCDFVCPVTRLAVLLQDGSNVFIECRWRAFCTSTVASRAAAQSYRYADPQQDECPLYTSHARSMLIHSVLRYREPAQVHGLPHASPRRSKSWNFPACPYEYYM